VPPPDEENSAALPDDKTRGARGRLLAPFMLLTSFARHHRQTTPTKEPSPTPFPRTESLPDTPIIKSSPVQMKPPSIRTVRSLPLTRAVVSNPSIVQESPPNPKSQRSYSLPQRQIPRSRSSSSSLVCEPDPRTQASPALDIRTNHSGVSPAAPSNNTLFLPSTSSHPSSSTSPGDAPPSQSNNRNPSGWRWFPFPNALLGSSGGASASNAVAQQTPPKKRRKKGDVDCLFYGTLDDQAMARLRGKSDHRPVIGVYSVAI
jgi:hypothetical protein